MTPPELAEDPQTCVPVISRCNEDFQDKWTVDQLIDVQLELDLQIKISERRPESFHSCGIFHGTQILFPASV